MNIIKSTFDFLGQEWSLMKKFGGYHFFAYNGVDTHNYKVTLYLNDKTEDGLLKKIQAEVNKCGFKVKKANVTKVKRKKK